MATSLGGVIAINPSAESALPTLPAAGSSILQSAWDTAGFSTIRARDFGNDHDIGEDTYKLSPTQRMEKVKAPISFGVQNFIALGSDFEPVEIKIYDTSAELYALASNLINTGGVVTETSVYTYRGVALEILDQGLVYFPRALVTFPTFMEGGSVEGQAMQAVIKIEPTIVQALDPADFPGGYNYSEYQ